jgi:hypothetical protein
MAQGMNNSAACREVGINRRTGTRRRYGRTVTNERRVQDLPAPRCAEAGCFDPLPVQGRAHHHRRRAPGWQLNPGYRGTAGPGAVHDQPRDQPQQRPGNRRLPPLRRPPACSGPPPTTQTGEATNQHRAARPGPGAAGSAVEPGTDLPDPLVAASRPARATTTVAHENGLPGGVPGRSRRPDTRSLAVAAHRPQLPQAPAQPRATDSAVLHSSGRAATVAGLGSRRRDGPARRVHRRHEHSGLLL